MADPNKDKFDMDDPQNIGAGMIGDNSGLDDSDDDNDFAPQTNNDQQVANFEDDDDDEDDEFGQQPDADDDDQDDEDNQDYKRPDFAFNSGNDSSKKNEDLNTKKVENQQFDEALDIEDSNEIESDDDEDQDNGMPEPQIEPLGAVPDGEGDQEVAGQYNPQDYANLNVSNDVKELFEYIGRYKTQSIALETTFRPFIPEFIP